MSSKRALGRVVAATLATTVTAGCTINLTESAGDQAKPSPPAESTTGGRPTTTTPRPSPSPSASASGASTPASSSDWASLTKEVRSGVLRLQVAGCDAGWSGTGFLLPDRYVVTGDSTS